MAYGNPPQPPSNLLTKPMVIFAVTWSRKETYGALRINQKNSSLYPEPVEFTKVMIMMITMMTTTTATM
jgi:hypothetical protein